MKGDIIAKIEQLYDELAQAKGRIVMIEQKLDKLTKSLNTSDSIK